MSKASLMEYLEIQLHRLIEQLKDLEDCKEELSAEEFDYIKDDALEQVQEFNKSINDYQKKDSSMTNQFTELKGALRQAIGESFNTQDMVDMFGINDAEVLQQLIKLEEDYRFNKIDHEAFVNERSQILLKIQDLC